MSLPSKHQISWQRPFLERIERTNLLFEDKSHLAVFLGLDEKYFINRNTLYNECRSKSRSISKVEDNLKSLCNYAHLISGNIAPENSDKMLLDIIDVYSAATESGHFSNPKNDRYKRYKRDRIIFESIKYNDDRLCNLINNLINNKADVKDDPLYRALRIDINTPHTIYRNYYTAIGILIYLRVIPFCDEKTRIKTEKWNLDEDTNKVRNFLAKLTASDTVIQNNINRLFDIYRKSHSEHWCRYHLILCFSRMLDLVIELSNKELVDQYEKSLKSEHIIPRQKYWFGRNFTEYILERPDGLAIYDFYLYKCEFKSIGNKFHLTKERFNFTMGPAIAEISRIDDFYKGIINSDYNTTHGIIGTINENHIEITPIYQNDFPEFDLKPMPEKDIEDLEMRIREAEHITIIDEDKALENLDPYAYLGAIMARDRLILLCDKYNKPVATIKPNETNKIKKVFDIITATDHIFIFKINGGTYLVTIIKGVVRSFDIADNPAKYGVRYL